MTGHWRAAFLLLGVSAASAASAAPPHDVLGFYPGQKTQEALALARKFAAQPCDVHDAKQCLVFNTDYLGRRSRIFLELDDKRGVTRVGLNISNDSQPKVPDCAKMAGEIIAGIAKAYGRFDESDPGASYTWRDARLKLRLNVICIPSVQHDPVGGVVGMFEPSAPR